MQSAHNIVPICLVVHVVLKTHYFHYTHCNVFLLQLYFSNSGLGFGITITCLYAAQSLLCSKKDHKKERHSWDLMTARHCVWCPSVFWYVRRELQGYGEMNDVCLGKQLLPLLYSTSHTPSPSERDDGLVSHCSWLFPTLLFIALFLRQVLARILIIRGCWLISF